LSPQKPNQTSSGSSKTKNAPQKTNPFPFSIILL
ncbi:conserved hypothetical protein, partial [Listeria seeligeri FSL S4-171]